MRTPPPPTPVPRRAGLADMVLGTLGNAVIRTVLAVGRLWARATRSSWHE